VWQAAQTTHLLFTLLAHSPYISLHHPPTRLPAPHPPTHPKEKAVRQAAIEKAQKEIADRLAMESAMDKQLQAEMVAAAEKAFKVCMSRPLHPP
jgi:hypothetical protein